RGGCRADVGGLAVSADVPATSRPAQEAGHVLQDLSVVLADYRAGLDAALDLLSQLEALSARQRADAAAPSVSPDAVAAHVAERQRLLDALLQLESRLKPLRDHITRHLETARAVPGFQVVAERHRAAADAVARIMQ